MSDMELPVFTLGWELEATSRAERKIKGVECGHDGSVDGDALEYRIKREMVYKPEESLRALRELLASQALEVNESCGFHVHIGLGVKSRKLQAWAAHFVTLARLVEKEAFAAVPKSRHGNDYCRSWKEHTGSVISPIYHASKHSNETRYCWINPVEIFRPGGIRTIEVRLMGDSQSYPYLLAWISFCRSMAASAWALTNDPSRLEMEVQELKEVLDTIRGCFVSRSIRGITQARAVVIMAAKAGLYMPFKRTLGKVREEERSVLYAVEMESRYREEYESQVQAMRDYLTMEKRSLLVLPIDELPKAGDLVEALCEDPDGYIEAGTQYEVVRVELDHHRLVIKKTTGGQWTVPFSCLKLVVQERRVAISVG